MILSYWAMTTLRPRTDVPRIEPLCIPPTSHANTSCALYCILFLKPNPFCSRILTLKNQVIAFSSNRHFEFWRKEKRIGKEKYYVVDGKSFRFLSIDISMHSATLRLFLADLFAPPKKKKLYIFLLNFFLFISTSISFLFTQCDYLSVRLSVCLYVCLSVLLFQFDKFLVIFFEIWNNKSSILIYINL